jgi:hypothetical protein
MLLSKMLHKESEQDDLALNYFAVVTERNALRGSNIKWTATGRGGRAGVPLINMSARLFALWLFFG